jgi:hypothetical protein
MKNASNSTARRAFDCSSGTTEAGGGAVFVGVGLAGERSPIRRR